MVLDSSFLIAYFVEMDANNSRALELAERHEKESMLLPDLVLYESLTLICYRKGAQGAKEAYEKISGNSQILLREFAMDEKREILGRFLSQKAKLGFVDTAILYLAEKTGSGIISFDRQLLKNKK